MLNLMESQSRGGERLPKLTVFNVELSVADATVSWRTEEGGAAEITVWSVPRARRSPAVGRVVALFDLRSNVKARVPKDGVDSGRNGIDLRFSLAMQSHKHQEHVKSS